MTKTIDGLCGKCKEPKLTEEDNPYCEVCGGCGYIGCCGIRGFLEKHVRGKTNCKNEDGFIQDIIDYCEDNEDDDC